MTLNITREYITEHGDKITQYCHVPYELNTEFKSGYYFLII